MLNQFYVTNKNILTYVDETFYKHQYGYALRNILQMSEEEFKNTMKKLRGNIIYDPCKRSLDYVYIIVMINKQECVDYLNSLLVLNKLIKKVNK